MRFLETEARFSFSAANTADGGDIQQGGAAKYFLRAGDQYSTFCGDNDSRTEKVAASSWGFAVQVTVPTNPGARRSRLP